MTTPGSISPQEVADLHARSDLDAGPFSQHHSLGIDPNQASPGDHDHDGRNSKKLYELINVTGSRADGSALLSLLQALERHGLITNSTTT